MSARDELAKIIHDEMPWQYSGDSDEDLNVADAILAAGYRKPRVITTLDELEALPVGTILLDVDGDACQRFRGGWRATINEPNDDPWLSDTLEVDLPATVVHEASK